MVAFLDKKYIDLLKYRFKEFEWKSGELANCKCFECEHESTKHKKRGYFIKKEGKFYYYCHNCNVSYNIKSLLKKFDQRLFQQYQAEEIEFFGKKSQLTNQEEITDVNNKLRFAAYKEADQALKRLKKISQLPWDHPAKEYINDRKIPTPYHSIFRWTPKFMAWTNTLIPGKFKKEALGFDEGRIVIPFFDQKNRFFAYTGRVLTDSNPRYALIVLDNDIPLLFGLFRTNLRRPLLAVEGPIDSVFLDNCLAMVGSNTTALTEVAEPANITVIFDNEPEKPETQKKLLAAINHSFKVCIWPRWVKFKDINEMILNDWEPEYIEDLIKSNTFSGQEAAIRAKLWSKV